MPQSDCRSSCADWISSPTRGGRIAFSTSRVFEFGQELRFAEPSAGAGGEHTSSKSLLEEGLETLLMLNLRTVVEEWNLTLKATSGAFGGADLLAVDPIGTLHVFELKYGANAGSSLMQAVAYALSAATQPAWGAFVASKGAWTEEFIARRVAGVWHRTRTDTLSRAGGGLPERDHDLFRLKAVAPSGWAELLEIGKQHVQRLAEVRSNPLTGILVSPAIHHYSPSGATAVALGWAVRFR